MGIHARTGAGSLLESGIARMHAKLDRMHVFCSRTGRYTDLLMLFYHRLPVLSPPSQLSPWLHRALAVYDSRLVLVPPTLYNIYNYPSPNLRVGCPYFLQKFPVPIKACRQQSRIDGKHYDIFILQEFSLKYNMFRLPFTVNTRLLIKIAQPKLSHCLCAWICHHSDRWGAFFGPPCCRGCICYDAFVANR